MMRLVIVTAETVGALWDQMRPLVDKCVRKTFNGELETDDVLALILRGSSVAIVGLSGEGKVELVSVFERIVYPRMTTLNLFVLAGSRRGVMADVLADWRDKVSAWARASGAQAIDCSCSDAMMKVISPFGFERKYNACRWALED